MSVSSPFFTPSLGAGSTHLPKSHTNDAHCAGASQTVPAGRSLSGSGGALSPPASVPPLDAPELLLAPLLLAPLLPPLDVDVPALMPELDEEVLLSPLDVWPELVSGLAGQPVTTSAAPKRLARIDTVVPLRPKRSEDCGMETPQ